jgi:hypothetical protein
MVSGFGEVGSNDERDAYFGGYTHDYSKNLLQYNSHYVINRAGFLLPVPVRVFDSSGCPSHVVTLHLSA